MSFRQCVSEENDDQVRVVRPTVNITETACFALFRMVETSGPVDGNVAFISVKTRSAFHAATGTNSAKLEKSVKDRTVITDVIPALLSCKPVHVVRRYFAQEVDVFVGMELRHFKFGGWFRAL